MQPAQEHVMQQIQNLQEGHVQSLREAEKQFTVGLFAFCIAAFYILSKLFINANEKEINNFISYVWQLRFGYLISLTIALLFLVIAERGLRILYHATFLKNIRKTFYMEPDGLSNDSLTLGRLADPDAAIKERIREWYPIFIFEVAKKGRAIVSGCITALIASFPIIAFIEFAEYFRVT